MSRFLTSGKLLVSALALLLWLFTIPFLAQAQSSCNYHNYNPPKGYGFYGFSPEGINDSNIVVGYTSPNNSSQIQSVGFVRSATGAFKLFSVPNANWTLLQHINANGVSVGGYGTTNSAPPPYSGSNGLIYTQKSWAKLNYPGSPSTYLEGINKQNTIVGTALNSKTKTTFGFVYQQGKFTKINYPGATQTIASSINDKGVIVGGYETGAATTGPWFGYILRNGVFKTVKYPLVDINNLGVMANIYNTVYFPDGKKIFVWDGAVDSHIGGLNDANVISGGGESNTTDGFFGWTATCQ